MNDNMTAVTPASSPVFRVGQFYLLTTNQVVLCSVGLSPGIYV